MTDHDHRQCPHNCKCCTRSTIPVMVDVPDTYRGNPVPTVTSEEEES